MYTTDKKNDLKLVLILKIRTETSCVSIGDPAPSNLLSAVGLPARCFTLARSVTRISTDLCSNDSKEITNFR